MTLHKPRSEKTIQKQIANRLKNPRSEQEISRQMLELAIGVKYFGKAANGPQTKGSEKKTKRLQRLLEKVYEASNEAIDPADAKRKVSELFLIMLRHALEQNEPLKSFIAIDNCLRVLMGDSYFGHLPNTMEEHLKARGIETDAMFMSPSEIVEALQIPLDESWIDTVLPTLDMIFEQRYGWSAGTAKNKTPPELRSALEFAVENDDPALQYAHDDPNRPNIWYMTRGYR